MVTIPFHQTLRATAPIFIILIYRLLYRSTYTRTTYLSLLPIILGVALATYGDYYFTRLGFLMTLLGTLLAACKTIVTNRLQTAGLHLSALELLYRMSPLAFVQSLAMAYLNGELTSFHDFALSSNKFSGTAAVIILVNGVMAFGLNVSSFSANKKAGALTMTVAANVKQILTVLLAILFWKLEVGWVNALGKPFFFFYSSRWVYGLTAKQASPLPSPAARGTPSSSWPARRAEKSRGWKRGRGARRTSLPRRFLEWWMAGRGRGWVTLTT